MEAHATLRVCTDEPEVDFITESLRLEPTSHALKDAPVSPRLPDHKRRFSVWLYRSSLDPSRKLEHHIEQVLGILETHPTAADALARRGCSIDIVCFVSSESGQAGAILTASLLRRLANQRIDVCLDLYPPESIVDESEPTRR